MAGKPCKEGLVRSTLRDVGKFTSWLPITFFLFFPAFVPAQENNEDAFVVMRDLAVIRGAWVAEFDVDGFELAGPGLAATEYESQRKYLWSQINSASVSPDRQADFDRFVLQLGVPLMRITDRMQFGDYSDLMPSVESLKPTLQNRQGDATYLMYAAEVRSLLHNGQRVEALIPVCHLLKLRQDDPSLQRWDRITRLTFDSETRICDQLTPVWFDQVQLEQSVDRLMEWVDANQEMLTPGGWLYLAMLDACLDDASRFEKQATNLTAIADEPWKALIAAIKAHRDGNFATVVDGLAQASFTYPSLPHALSLYFSGLAKSQLGTDEHADAALRLLQIPAKYGARFPELSAAAIHLVVREDLAGESDYRSLEQELRQQYANTYFGRLSEDQPSDVLTHSDR